MMMSTHAGPECPFIAVLFRGEGSCALSVPGKAVRAPGTAGARLAGPVPFHLPSSFPRHH